MRFSALVFLLCALHAQAFPVAGKPVRIVVPFPPGGQTDIQARAIAQKMAETLGAAVIVENKPGGSTLIGARDVQEVCKEDGLVVVAALMFAAAGLALAMRPTQKIADERERPDLNTMIPHEIANWKIDTSIVPIRPSPDAQAYLDKIYNQTLSRTYVHPDGESILLSIAYGADQSDNLRVHAPKVCYAAQGFEVLGTAVSALATQYGPLPVKRLFAVRGSRNEPITYWVVVGDKATPAGIKQKLAQLSHGLTGKVPDAFLVRVSSLSSDLPDAYRQHEDFIKAMLGAMNEKNRLRITGQIGAQSLAAFSEET